MDHLRALADCQEQFLASTRRADPTTPIPWLGRWTVEKLVVHLARIHHWAAAQARREQETPLGRGPFDLPQLYGECAAELRATLAELDPDAPAWALVDDGVPPEQHTGTVRFWHRRQLHETLVHLWDLRTAIGEPLDAVGVDAVGVDTGGVDTGGFDTGRFEPGDEAWIDCLDEVLTVMHPRQLRLERVAPPAARIVFSPSGADVSLTLGGAADDAPEVVIAGPARSLALLAWGRGVPDGDRLAAVGVEVEGDRALAEAIVRAGLTP